VAPLEAFLESWINHYSRIARLATLTIVSYVKVKNETKFI